MPKYCGSQFGLRVRWRRAGTDADVTLMLWGSKAASGVISLRDSDHVNKFERAQTDTFKYIVLTCIKLYYNYIIIRYSIRSAAARLHAVRLECTVAARAM
jgi:hypothetical protein